MVETFRVVVAGLCGLTVGSFLNVVIWRLPRGQNLSRPRSSCPGCKSLIRWFDNIPVLSWLLLRGRCRRCRTPIAVRYPVVELLTGALFVWAALVFGHHLVTLVVACLALAALVAITYIDWDHKIIPDAISKPGAALAILTAPFTLLPQHPASLIPGAQPGLDALAIALVGAAVGGGIILAIRWIGAALLKKEAMGLGDVKLMAFLGALVGPLHVLYVLMIGSVAGAVIGLLMFAVNRNRPMPSAVHVRGKGIDQAFTRARVADGELLLPHGPEVNAPAPVEVTWHLPADRVLEDEDARIEARGTLVRRDPQGAWRLRLDPLSEVDDERVALFRSSYKYIPFGPFLVAGGICLLLAGPHVHHFATVTYPAWTRSLLGR